MRRGSTLVLLLGQLLLVVACSYHLRISSTPPGARIEVDGVDTGHVTPASIHIPTGPMHVALDYNGVKTSVEIYGIDMGFKLGWRRWWRVSTSPDGCAWSPLRGYCPPRLWGGDGLHVSFPRPGHLILQVDDDKRPSLSSSGGRALHLPLGSAWEESGDDWLIRGELTHPVVIQWSISQRRESARVDVTCCVAPWEGVKITDDRGKVRKVWKGAAHFFGADRGDFHVVWKSPDGVEQRVFVDAEPGISAQLLITRWDKATGEAAEEAAATEKQ